MITSEEAKFYRKKYWPSIRVVFIAVVIFIIYTLVQNIIIGENSRIRKFILKGKKAVEAKNIITCAEMISQNYSDKYGNDRSSLIIIAREIFKYYQNIFVNIESMEIYLDESKTKAEVTIVALVLGRTNQNNQEKFFEGEKGKFILKIEKNNRKWRLLEIEFFEPITIMGQHIS